MRTAVLSGLTALGIAVAFALPAAQVPANPQPFQTEVNYVRVDMYPTAGGRPVADLAAEDVELLEDGTVQKIAKFEHVSISGPRPQTMAPEPSTLAGMRRAAQDPRARVFALFIDPHFVTLASSMQVRKPLIDAINKLVGGEDLIAVMTPDMSPEALTFTRRTNSVETLLAGHWGEKGWTGTTDPIEFAYEACYPDVPGADTQGIAPEMIRRRREKLTLDALEGLAAHLTNLREDRKAVITVSEGWPLYGPNESLARALKYNASGLRPITNDPRTGKPTTKDPNPLTPDHAMCESHRLALSQLQNEDRFLAILQAANRGNVSFYPIDPRGLTANRQTGVNTLRTMAEVTDGLAITEQNIEAGLQRVVDDLSSYYLLGYYSPAKPDGKYHRITVRVKRPGVQVRARAGYLAAKPPAATRSAAPVAPASAADAAEARLVSEAIGTLSSYARERPLRLQVASEWLPGGVPGVWVVAEVPRNVSGDDWSKGGTAEVRLLDDTGATLLTQEAALPASAGPISARVFLKAALPITPGEYQIRVRASSAGVLPASEMARITVALPPAGSGVLFNRRGASTGNREAATADLRFRRTERVIVLLPASSTQPAAGRLLDRAGKALAIPVAATTREEPDGSRWYAAELALAPLAPGDYLLELTAAAERTLSAFRVLP